MGQFNFSQKYALDTHMTLFLALSQDERHLLSINTDALGVRQSVVYYDVARRRILHNLRHLSPAFACFLDPDQALTVDRLGVVRFWDLQRGVANRTIQTEGKHSFLFSVDDDRRWLNMCALRGHAVSILIDLVNGEVVREYDGWGTLSPTGQLAIRTPQEIALQDAQGQTPPRPIWDDPEAEFAFSPDGHNLVLATSEHLVGLSVQTQQRQFSVALPAGTTPPKSLCVSSSGKYVAYVQPSTSTVMIWDVVAQAPVTQQAIDELSIQYMTFGDSDRLYMCGGLEEAERNGGFIVASPS